MKLVFYTNFLNHHQVMVADEFYKILGNDFAFVTTVPVDESLLKGGLDYSTKRDYCVRAYSSDQHWNYAMQLALEAEVCVFGSDEALPFEKARLDRNLLSFDMGERMLKRGLLNLLSPRVIRKQSMYYRYRWNSKPLYKLCCSAFAKQDLDFLRSYTGKCYKWGYFTSVPKESPSGLNGSKGSSGCEKVDSEILMQHQPSSDCSARADILQSPRDICFSDDGRKTASTSSGQAPVEASTDVSTSEITPLMWCSRFLMLKHPELPVQMAKRLKDKGYRFRLDMYGDEGNAAKYDKAYPRKQLETLIAELGVGDCVRLMGNRPNNEILEAMQKSSIFLFTSDKNEGWGAVANESMANGCALVASDAIGSSPYLIKDGFNGFMFKSCDVDSLTEKVMWLLDHPEELKQMQQNATKVMQEVWSPANAARSLLRLIDNLKQGKETDIKEGPCSKA